VAILAYDDVMLREPRLLMPKMQPLGLVKVDRSNPLSRGLIYQRLFTSPYGITAISGGPTQAYSPYGQGTYFDGSDDYITTNRPSFIGPQSFACGIILHAWNSDDMVMSAGSADSNYYNNALFFGSGNTNKLAYGRTGAPGNSAWRDEATAITIGKYTQYCWTWDSANTGTTVYGANLIRCFKDGREDGTANNYANGNGAIGETGTELFIAVDKYSSTFRRYGNQTLFYVFVWNRALTPAEACEVSANPYQFLIPA
jgi:hypothetical protein